MTSIRHLSQSEAVQRVTLIALRLAESSKLNGWQWELIEVKPDPVRTEVVGKTALHWVCIVQFSKGNSAWDGPGVILVNLESEVASWWERP